MDTSPVTDVKVSGERRERLVRAEDPRFRLKDGERALGNADGIPALGLVTVEAVPLDAAGLQRVGGALLERPDDLEQAVQLEQRLAGLGFELAPEPQRLLGEPHVFLLPIGEAEDPRPPVAGAALVPGLELLVDDHVVPAMLQGAAGREAHHAGSYDSGLHRNG